MLCVPQASYRRCLSAGTLREVAHASAVGCAATWDALEDAGKLVLLAARDSAADVVARSRRSTCRVGLLVQHSGTCKCGCLERVLTKPLLHRHGQDAAAVAVSGINTLGNSANAVYSVRKLGPKTVGRAAVKEAAKGVLGTGGTRAGAERLPAGGLSAAERG